MATVQSHMNGFDPSLEDLPTWKKDLILRRRANARIHGGLPVRSGVRSAPHSPPITPQQQNLPRLLQGPSQLSLRPLQGSQESLRAMRGPNTNSSQLNSVSIGSNKCLRRSEIACCSVPKGCDSAVDEGFPCVTAVGTAMRGPSVMHHKGVTFPEGMAPEGWHLNEDEEFEYGPGIVSRLKNRYMSLALREAKSRASLRKYSSLEDLLDDGGQERGRSMQKERTSAGGASLKREVMKRTRSMDSLSIRRTDSNDKVHKSRSSGALRQALGKEDIIIIEAPRPSENGAPAKAVQPPVAKKASALREEEDMPTPDIVKQVKKIFEPCTGRASRGTAAKVAAYKAAQAKKQDCPPPSLKPPLKAKPPQLQNKKALSPTIENARSSLKQVQPGTRSSPRSTLSVKAPTPSSKTGVGASTPPVSLGLTPISASVTFPHVNGEDAKSAHSPAISSKLNEMTPQGFEFPLGAPPHHETHPRPHSPPTPLPPSPTPTHKVSTPPSLKGEPTHTKENERVLQENKKNAEKSHRPFVEVQPKVSPPTPPPASPPAVQPKSPTFKPAGETSQKPPSHQEGSRVPVPSVVEAPSEPETSKITSVPPSSGKTVESSNTSTSSPSVLEVIRAAEAKSPPDSPSSLGLKPTRTKEARRHQQQENSTLVFNFSNRTDTPNYIENDGVDLSKRHFSYKHESGYVIMPGYDGKNDSSTDGDDDAGEDAMDTPRLGVPPPPCNITFEGEGVIINGRSNLQRQPRAKKLEVSFDMPSTRTFGYPSEDSLMREFDEIERQGLPAGADITSGTSVSTGRTQM